jgi:hypothetical protein
VRIARTPEAEQSSAITFSIGKSVLKSLSQCHFVSKIQIEKAQDSTHFMILLLHNITTVVTNKHSVRLQGGKFDGISPWFVTTQHYHGC